MRKKSRKNNTANEQNKVLRKKLIKYGLIVTVLSFVFFGLVNLPFFMPYSDAINSFYARLSGSILNLFGADVFVNQTEIWGSEFHVSIKTGCDALAPMILFATSILAFPAPFRAKFLPVIIGFFILGVLNIIRIITLYYSGLYGSQEFFRIMHEDVWQIFFIAFTVLLWLIWIRSDFSKSES